MRPLVGGIDCRAEDSEPTRALHSIAILFRIMAGLLLVVMAIQILLGVTSSVGISFGVLFGEVIRLVIFAGLLWAAGDLADLFIKSQCDIRTTRILLTRLVGALERRAADPVAPDAARGPDDAPRAL
jgi:hypothetical protein